MRSNMKICIYVFASILFSACTIIGSVPEEIDGGFPDEITFPKEGGELNITGEISICAIHILYNGEEVFVTDSTDGNITATLDWLTTRTQENSTQIQLCAEANTTAKSRKAYVLLNWGILPKYVRIAVIQE